ncbi:MAG: DNA polymerase III subunit delta' [Candidatus Omnitrophota bacterium]|nr:DNA polymerase III subunit delta' [Candidatus Omnitrophota bacterium]
MKGQHSAIGYLKAGLESGRISPAYIFSGPDGVGKRITAINFAKALNCDNIKSGESCDQCPSCKKIDSLKHPDVYILSPEEDGGSIKIEDVRAVIKDVYLKPFEAKRKVYIIEAAQELKHEAANALLKTLEEPPADSIIILLTENIKALLHTIVSRSQIVKFFSLKLKEVQNILVKEYLLTEDDAHILAHLSGGMLGSALKFKEDGLLTKRSLLIDRISSGLKDDFDFDDIPKGDVRMYLDMMLAWYRDILNTKIGAGDHMLVNIDKRDIISNEANILSFENLEETINSIISTVTHIDKNANQKLAMSVLGMRIKQVSACTK